MSLQLLGADIAEMQDLQRGEKLVVEIGLPPADTGERRGRADHRPLARDVPYFVSMPQIAAMMWRSTRRRASCSIRDGAHRAVRAIASARSAERFVQYSASAARVGSERPKSTCGNRVPITGATVRPSTHTSFATHAVGRRGSSPGANTRPVPPGSTATFDPSSTANSRSTSGTSPSGPPRRASSAPGSTSSRHRPGVAARSLPAAHARSRRPRMTPAPAPPRHPNRGRWRAPRRRRARPGVCPARPATRGPRPRRIDGRILQPPIQHVDRLQPVECAQPTRRCRTTRSAPSTRCTPNCTARYEWSTYDGWSRPPENTTMRGSAQATTQRVPVASSRCSGRSRQSRAPPSRPERQPRHHRSIQQARTRSLAARRSGPARRTTRHPPRREVDGIRREPPGAAWRRRH